MAWLYLLRDHRGAVTFEINSVSGEVDGVMLVHCLGAEIGMHGTNFEAAPSGTTTLHQQLDDAAERLKSAEDRHLAGEEVPAWV